MPSIGCEDGLGRHRADSLGHVADDIQHFRAPDKVHQGDDDQPYEERTAADDEGVFQADDIAETGHSRTYVELEDQLGLVGHGSAPGQHLGRNGLSPPAEGRNDEVVDTSYQAADEQQLGILAAVLAADEHLGGGSRLREGILPVHILDKIFSERNEEKYTEHAAEQGTEEHLAEIHRQLGELGLEDVQRRESEYGTGHDGSAAGADRLDDDILGQGILALAGA